jgi:hypothetical protein
MVLVPFHLANLSNACFVLFQLRMAGKEQRNAGNVTGTYCTGEKQI